MEPIRTCLGCRVRRPQRTLVRLAAHAGAVRADPGRDRPGRGAWVCPGRECVDRAVGDGGRRLRRALRTDHETVTLDPTALREAVLALSDDPTPPPSDASRGVPT